MGREDFNLCTDEELRSAIYSQASEKATKWHKSAKKGVERKSDLDSPGVFSYSDLEDWFVMAIAKRFELEELFSELFESELGRKFVDAWDRSQLVET